MNRRHFIQTAAAVGILGHAPFILGQNADRKHRVALIGSGWWGKNILREAIASEKCKVVAICDADTNVMEVAAEQISDLNGDTPKSYVDDRELLEKEKPDIVIIATPDHWHALQTIAALKAGAHVFVEKPTGHTVNESKAML
ncbi:MAG: Gfo/Idh/MocA family oxidoreductase, partial [Verrucomicrobiota bacterium]